jgi:actin-like ATPase involved in cell morphogenesis
MSYSLGIDIGTASTSAALGYGTHVEMLSLGDAALIVPSAVFATRDGELLTGEEAVRRAVDEPGGLVRGCWRRLGDATPVAVSGRTYPPTELVAAIVRDVVAKARFTTGSDPASVVLTHPAVWGTSRLEQLGEAAGIAGVDHYRLLPEPVAVAAYHLSESPLPAGALMAVYDLGAETCDTAILRAGEPIALVGRAEGLGVGGADFDHIVLTMIDEMLDGLVGRLDPTRPEDAATLARLWTDAAQAKEALSSEPVVLTQILVNDRLHTVRLTRADFELRIAPVVDRTIETLWRVLDATDTDATGVDALLLSGGATRVPLVARRLESEFGIPVRAGSHPEHVVALGAARLARRDAEIEPPTGIAAIPGRRARPDVAPTPSAAGPRRRIRFPRPTAVIALAIAVVAGAVTSVILVGMANTDSPPNPHNTPVRARANAVPTQGARSPAPSAYTTPPAATSASSSPSPTQSSSRTQTPDSGRTTAVASPAPGAAKPTTDGPFSYSGLLRNWGTGNCLDGDDAGNVYQLACNGTAYQNWRIEYYSAEPGGLYRVVHLATGRCLDSNYGTEANVYTLPCQDPNHWQKWRLAFPTGDRNYLQFRNVETAWCVTFPDTTRVRGRDACGVNNFAMFKPG